MENAAIDLAIFLDGRDSFGEHTFFETSREIGNMAFSNITRRAIFSLATSSSIPAALTLARAAEPASPQAPTRVGLDAILHPRTEAETAARVVPANYEHPPGNVLRYGTNDAPGTTDVSSAFQAAFDQQAHGGAVIYVPTGIYRIDSVVSTATAAPFALHGDGMGKTVIVAGSDADCFVISNSISALNQITISDLTISPAVAMSKGSALSLTCTGIIPSVTLRNIMVLCSGTSVFRQGIKLRNCGEVELSRVFIYGIIGSNSMVGVSVTQSVAATVYKFVGCSIYNVEYGFTFTDETAPGIEGIQFYGCDIVGVHCGVLYTNAFGSRYFPPQLTWIGGHINASVRSFDLSIMCQVFIKDLLSYNSGNFQHIRLTDVADVSIQGNTFIQIGGTADGITMSAGGKFHGGIVAANLFRMGAGGSAVNLDATNLRDLTISDNQRVSGSTTVNVSAGALDGSILILDNTPRDTVDIYDATLTGAISMTLAGIRSDYCYIKAPSRATTCSALTSRHAWDRVILDCASNLLTLTHNAVPDGFFLAGGVDYTFPATGGRITLEKRNGGYWTEVARSC
jgi:hypothetical protein